MTGSGNRYLERVLDSVTDPVIIYSRGLKIIRVNQVIEALFGQPAHTWIGRSYGDLFHIDGDHPEGCVIEEVFRGGEPRMSEMSVCLPDGSTRYFECNCYPVKGPKGKVVQVIEHARDISRRKSLERDLKASEERYRTMVETAREGIYIVDREARLTFANKRLARMLGYRPEEILSRPMFDFLNEEGKALANANFERRRKGLSDVYELRFVRKDGNTLDALVSVAPLTENGSFAGAMGILTDITCLKRAEAALQQAKAFGEKILNGITDDLAVINPKTYQIILLNRSFLMRIGVEDPGAAVGKACYQVLRGRSSPCEEDGEDCPVRRAYLTKQPAYSDRAFDTQTGAERVFQVSTYPLLDDEGNVEMVVRLKRDVTEKQTMEKTLAVRSKELHRIQNRLETLFEISRQIGTRRSLVQLIQYLHDVIMKIFPASEPLFFILNATGEQTLPLDGCDPQIVEPIQKIQNRLEECGLTSCFTHFLRKSRSSSLMTSEDAADVPPFLRAISESYPSWFTHQICVQDQCIGLFFLGSKTFVEHSPEDLRFIYAIFEQASGHLRHMVSYEAEISNLRRQVAERSSYGDMIGQSKKMQEIYELIDLVAGSDATVLITGENGTGKELVAHAIHRYSHRNKGPFVVANCSAYSQTLLESELFGHEKGSFTGAIRQKKGRMELAHGGTLFLDEIGDIAPATQILLLRFLQDHCFERVGGEKTIAADVRILAATNRDLEREVQAERFRNDLYYRLNVISVHLPPLRERKEDIPLLAQHFLKRHGMKEQKTIPGLSSNAMQALMDYEWPGNVRQLENALSHAVVLCQGDSIRKSHLPRFLRDIAEEESVPVSLAENERVMILRALKEANWNKHDTARRLRVSRSTLYSKIRRYGLEPGG